MDDVHLPFESILQYDTFSIRIDEGAASHLPHILRAIPKSTVATMQVGGGRSPGGGAAGRRRCATLAGHFCVRDDCVCLCGLRVIVRHWGGSVSA